MFYRAKTTIDSLKDEKRKKRKRQEIHNFKRNESCNVTLEYSKPNVPNVMLSSKYIYL